MRRLARCAWLILAAATVGCFPPRGAQSSGELDALRRRVDRSRADVEGVVRLASELWVLEGSGAAVEVLRQARAAVPEEPSYAAALGVALETDGRFLEARDEYLAFVSGTVPSELTRTLLDRIDALRAETAGPLAARLVAEGTTLEVGVGPGDVVAVTPFRSAAGDPDLTRLAAAATDLLVRHLRETNFSVVDWELTGALADALGPRESAPLAAVIADVVGAQNVVGGSIERLAGDTVVISLEVFVADAGGGGRFSRDSLVSSLPAYAQRPSAVALRAWEMLLGAPAGSIRGHPIERLEGSSEEDLLLLGDAILAQREREADVALQALTPAATDSPFDPLADKLAELSTLAAFRNAPSLPLADEILEMSMRRADAVQLMRYSSPMGQPARGTTRNGVSEALGLDRLGAQTFVELLVVVGGAP